MGPCIGLDADMIEICQKVEYAMRKYDMRKYDMTFEMVVAMVKGFHEEWSNADQTEPPECHLSERSLV